MNSVVIQWFVICGFKSVYFDSFLTFLQGEEEGVSADGKRKQYRKQRTVQSWEFEAEGEIAQPEFMVNNFWWFCEWYSSI